MFQGADIGIVCIATNSYHKFWLDLVASAYENIENRNQVEFYLFTDRDESELNISKFKDRFTFHIFNIPPYAWPEATLKRYEVIDNFRSVLTNKFLMYLDSDMLIRQDFTSELKELLSKFEMVLVRHPGYYRPKRLKLAKFYFSHCQFFFRDLILMFKLGGIGAWETRQNSTAFVPRSMRKDYVCGGTWFGQKEVFLNYVHLLKNQVLRDESKNLMAVWHDESHLNSLAANFKVELIDPAFCFDPRYPNLFGLPNFIEAVNKNET